jgi:hypothetical protein
VADTTSRPGPNTPGKTAATRIAKATVKHQSKSEDPHRLNKTVTVLKGKS